MSSKPAAAAAPFTITKLWAENILKFERFSLDQPGRVTVLRGPNDLGKTTALKLLSLAVKGSADPKSIIHDGAEKGEIGFEFLGYKLRRSFTQKGQYLSIIDDEGRSQTKPQQWLDDRIGQFRDFNPLAWLSMSGKEQIAILLRAIDVRLTEKEFTDATGREVPIGVSFDAHGLLVLDALRDHYVEERKIENRTADQKKKAVAEHRAQLPEKMPVITDERRELVTRTLDEAKTSRAAIEARQLAAKQHQSAVDSLDLAIAREERAIKDLDEENERLLAVIRKNEQRQKQIGEQIAKLGGEKKALESSAPPTQAEIEAVNVVVRNARELATTMNTDLEVISHSRVADQIEQEANDAAARAAIIDETIKTINGDLRTKLLGKAKLPVGSLAVEGDAILVDGHPLQHAAESHQIRVALAIARSLNPKLKVIILDGSERLDATTFRTFLEETRGDGFQYFAAEVDRNGSALEILSFGEDGVSSPAVAEVLG